MNFHRYAIYFTPTGDLASFGAAWLGWNLATGQAVTPPDVKDLPLPWDEITKTPRKYGFHATIKPPFRLAQGCAPVDLEIALKAHCRTLAPIAVDGLELAQLGRFLALVPTGDTTALNALAAATVRALDPFRAPPSTAELTRRRTAQLTPEQDALLMQWGYPYVMDHFRCHLTLTGKLPKAQTAQVRTTLAPLITPLIPHPFIIDTLSLCGEDAQGRFHLIHRQALSG